MNPDNDWYGHKRIFADYCQIDNTRPIFGYIPHGWYFDVPQEAGTRRFKSAPYFAWNMRHADQLKAIGIANVQCVGAPFVYLYRMMFDGATPDGSGTIFFPSHSAEGTVLRNQVQTLVDLVESNFPPPYTVSLYYQDLSIPDAQLYFKNDWRVVSFGSRNDQLFLYRQIIELSSHAHVVGNSPQTALWYGALLSRHVAVIGDQPDFASFGPTHNEEDVRSSFNSVFQRTRDTYPRLFTGGTEGEESFLIGSTELGLSFALDADDLRHVLGWSSVTKSLLALAVAKSTDLRLGRSARQGNLS